MMPSKSPGVEDYNESPTPKPKNVIGSNKRLLHIRRTEGALDT